MAYKYGNICIFNTQGKLVSMPNYASWIDMAIDDSKTITEKMEMLLTMAEYAKSLPKDWPRWNDGSPVIVGQVAVSMHGPMVIGDIDPIRKIFLTNTGYEIDASHPYHMGEYQEFWPGNDDHFAEHIFYHEATGAIGPQCKGGKYTWEAGVLGYDEYNDDVRLPQEDGVDLDIKPKFNRPTRIYPSMDDLRPKTSNE